MMTATAFLHIMARRQVHLAPIGERATVSCARTELLPYRERLWAAMELLSALDEAVGPARDQLMQQELNALHSEILRPTLRLSARQLASVITTLSELNHEATRATPDVEQFCQHARLVIDTMLLGRELVQVEEDVNIRIIAEDDALTDSEQRHLRQASAHISRYFRNVVSVEWHVSQQGRDRLVSCTVHSGSGYYRARVGSDVTEGSIAQALDKIVRQRRRRKAIRETARRHISHDAA